MGSRFKKSRKRKLYHKPEKMKARLFSFASVATSTNGVSAPSQFSFVPPPTCVFCRVGPVWGMSITRKAQRSLDPDFSILAWCESIRFVISLSYPLFQWLAFIGLLFEFRRSLPLSLPGEERISTS